LGEALPQSHVEVWAGMGHHPQRERPRQLARFIEERAARVHERAVAQPPRRRRAA
jgi:pimeloyl-ACP methyl ester carboxylesterase